MWHKTHLSDRQLLDGYLDRRSAGAESARLALPPHADTCSACAQRYAELARDFELMATDGAEEADAVFTSDRLAAQQQRIMRRIAQHGRRADIFLFPARGALVAAPVRRGWHPLGWAAAAAVVGLAAGLTLGMTLDRFGFDGPPSRPVAAAARTTSGGSDRPAGVADRSDRPTPMVNEDELLDSIDSTLTTRRVPELLIYDEMTPERIAFSPRLR